VVSAAIDADHPLNGPPFSGDSAGAIGRNRHGTTREASGPLLPLFYRLEALRSLTWINHFDGPRDLSQPYGLQAFMTPPQRNVAAHDPRQSGKPPAVT
jgi:hypothetical protein